MAQLNYHHLYYFYVTAREGSIVAAANKLHVTPQTVSGQLATFEDYLNAPLFDRRGKRLVLNHAGKLALKYAEDIFSLGHDLLETLTQNRDQRIATFSIGITDVVPKVLAFELFRSVLEYFSETRFIYREGDMESLIAELSINRLDLIIADRPVPPGTHIKAFSHAMGETGISFFASPDAAKELSEGFPLSLNKLPFLLPSDKSSLKTSLLSWFERLKIEPRIYAEFDDSALLKLFGQEGYGVFCAPSCIEQHIARQYQVSCIGHSDDVIERLYAISPERELKNDIVVRILNAAKSVI